MNLKRNDVENFGEEKCEIRDISTCSIVIQISSVDIRGRRALDTP